MEVNASDIIAGIALAFSGYVWWRQKGVNDLAAKLHTLEIQKALEEKAALQRAELSARFDKTGHRTYFLKIFNRGPSNALNVSLEALGEDHFMLDSDMSAKFPVDHLAPQEGIRVLAAPTLGGGSGVRIRLKWEDGSGSRERAMTVHI